MRERKPQGIDRPFSYRHLFRYGIIPAILGFCLLTGTAPAQAHRVLVYAYAEGDTIRTESKFAGGGPVQRGQVQILDQKSGSNLLGGTTDDQGQFSFPVPPEAAARRLDLLIVVEASLGHRGEWQLRAESYLPRVEKETTPPAPSAPAAVTSTQAPGPDVKTVALDSQLLEDTLNRVLERQLASMKEMLVEAQLRKPTLTDILGGLGYIMGIFGLLAYWQSKRKRDS